MIKKIFDSIDEISREAAKLLASLPAKSGSSSPAPSVRKLNGQNGDHKQLNGDLNAASETGSNTELNVITNGFDNLKVGNSSDKEYEALQVSSLSFLFYYC